MKTLRRWLRWMKSRSMKIGATGVTLIPALEYARSELPAVRDLVPDSTYKFIALAAFVAMIWLRVVTTQPVTAYEKQEDAQ